MFSLIAVCYYVDLAAVGCCINLKNSSSMVYMFRHSVLYKLAAHVLRVIVLVVVVTAVVQAAQQVVHAPFLQSVQVKSQLNQTCLAAYYQ
jgi:Na+-translocating ferredoxin:NAD+ oxidoreductase RnfA subunit